jgi:hypothetical protein
MAVAVAAGHDGGPGYSIQNSLPLERDRPTDRAGGEPSIDDREAQGRGVRTATRAGRDDGHRIAAGS